MDRRACKCVGYRGFTVAVRHAASASAQRRPRDAVLTVLLSKSTSMLPQNPPREQMHLEGPRLLDKLEFE